jgi:uncharacterized protein
MTEEAKYKDPNYGTVGEQETVAGDSGRIVAGSGDEKAWGALAHLSIFVNLVTGALGPVVALVIWLVYRDRSREVAFQALQSMWYQVAWLIIIAAGWAITGILTLVLIGFLLMPFMALLTLVPFVHSAYAAYKVGKGEEFRYPVIADMVEGR